MHLYLDVLEMAGHDFVVPPLTSAELAHIIRGAILKGQAHALRRNIPRANHGFGV